MRATPLEEIRRAVHGRWRTAAAAAVSVEAVTIDTRSARPGELFVAIRGDRHDGHDFLDAAAEAGCSAAIVQRDYPLKKFGANAFGGGIIGVEDTTTALGELASLARDQLTGEVVAVTGSVGKTTVKRMIHHVLSRRLTGFASPKSFNNQIGVPLTLLEAPVGADFVVCEVGANAPGEIGALTRIVRPALAVITSAAPSHLEGFGSLERIAAEKASLLGGLKRGGMAVVWADSPQLLQAVKPYEARVIRFGQSDQAELRLTGYEPDGLRQRFQVNDRLWVDLPLPGRHNAINALAALAAARRFGMDEAEAAAALADFASPAMRMEARLAAGITVINDAYNANPASMAAAVDVLKTLQARRRVLIAGDMRELGAEAEQYHGQIGQAVAEAGIEVLVTVGELGAIIGQSARRARADMQTHHFATAAECAEGVGELIAAGDAVLLKASRAVGLEVVAEKLLAQAK